MGSTLTRAVSLLFAHDDRRELSGRECYRNVVYAAGPFKKFAGEPNSGH